MYRTLFELKYTHEYYSDNEPVDFHLELSPRTQKLFTAVDLVVNKSLGRTVVRWNNRRLDEYESERQTLLDDLSDEIFIFYLRPVDPDVFYKVTAGIRQTLEYRQRTYQQSSATDAANGERLETIGLTTAFLLFQLGEGNNLLLTPESCESEKLTFLAEPADIAKLKLLPKLENIVNIAELNGITTRAEIEQRFTQTELISLVQKAQNHGVVSLPRLKCIESLVKQNKFDKDKLVLKGNSDSEIQELYRQTHRDARIVLSLPVRNIAKTFASSPLRVHFSSLAVRYKYYFMTLKEEGDLVVKSSAVNCVSAYETVGSQHRVPTFVTESEIKLERRPKENFSLVRCLGDREESVIDDLPHPKPENIFKHRDGENNEVNVIEAFIN